MTVPPTPEARYRAVLAKRREGETLVSLAKRQSVNLHTLYWWNQRLAKRAREQRGEKKPAETALVPVEATPLTLSAIVSPSFDVALRGSGHVVHVPARFDATALRRLVDTLEA